jgi:hypothetical protein
MGEGAGQRPRPLRGGVEWRPSLHLVPDWVQQCGSRFVPSRGSAAGRAIGRGRRLGERPVVGRGRVAGVVEGWDAGGVVASRRGFLWSSGLVGLGAGAGVAAGARVFAGQPAAACRVSCLGEPVAVVIGEAGRGLVARTPGGGVPQRSALCGASWVVTDTAAEDSRLTDSR